MGDALNLTLPAMMAPENEGAVVPPRPWRALLGLGLPSFADWPNRDEILTHQLLDESF